MVGPSDDRNKDALAYKRHYFYTKWPCFPSCKLIFVEQFLLMFFPLLTHFAFIIMYCDTPCPSVFLLRRLPDCLLHSIPHCAI